MNVSVAAIAEYLREHGLDEDHAPALVEYLRADETRRGQNQDTRNIHDYLKSMSTEDVKQDLETTRTGLVPIFYNVAGDFNLSSGVRNANWYNCESVWIIGRKKWDRRGAVGSHNYIDLKYNTEIFSVLEMYRHRGYRLVAAEISEQSNSLDTYVWQDKSVVIFGEESAGIPDNVLNLVDDVIHIPGLGSVRSINVSTASGTFMYDYCKGMQYFD